MGGPGSGREREPRTAAERDALLMIELPGSTLESAKAAANSIVEALKHGLHPKDAEAITKAVSVVARCASVDRHAQTLADMKTCLLELKEINKAALAREAGDRQHLGGEEEPFEENDPGDPPPH